jgi:threonine 3-dehydrogenase
MTTAATSPAQTLSSVSSKIPSTMKALYKHHAGVGLAMDPARAVPALGARDVLIKVTAAGVCGTDRHIWEWDDWAAGRIPVGITTGHEFVGKVVAIGPAVSRVSVGQRVSGESHISPGTGFNARTGAAHIADEMVILGVDRDGCFAEYVSIPEDNIWPIHASIPDHIAAIHDPLGNAVHTVMEAGVSAQNVLITGVGIIGLMAVTVARAAGASRIFVTDVDPRRLAIAKQLGATEAFDGREAGWVEYVKKNTHNGVDVLLEMSGAAPAINAGFSALRPGGTAALLGIPSKPFAFDLTNHVIFKGCKLLGINGRKMFQTWYQMESLLLGGRLNLEPIITHQLPMQDFAKAFSLMQSGEGIKVILKIEG